jgi:hypothetical protein
VKQKGESAQDKGKIIMCLTNAVQVLSSGKGSRDTITFDASLEQYFRESGMTAC